MDLPKGGTPNDAVTTTDVAVSLTGANEPSVPKPPVVPKPPGVPKSINDPFETVAPKIEHSETGADASPPAKPPDAPKASSDTVSALPVALKKENVLPSQVKASEEKLGTTQPSASASEARAPSVKLDASAGTSLKRKLAVDEEGNRPGKLPRLKNPAELSPSKQEDSCAAAGIGGPVSKDSARVDGEIQAAEQVGAGNEVESARGMPSQTDTESKKQVQASTDICAELATKQKNVSGHQDAVPLGPEGKNVQDSPGVPVDPSKQGKPGLVKDVRNPPGGALKVESATGDKSGDDDDDELDLSGMRKHEYEQVAKFGAVQLQRYEQYRRSDLKKEKIKKVLTAINPLLAKSSDQFLIAVKGLAKVFVGDIVEEALEVRGQCKEEGALQPKHLREAYRRMQKAGAIPTMTPRQGGLG